MNTDFNAFVRSAGLPELEDMDRRDLLTDFLPAAITGLSDGDLYVLHEEYSGSKAELYGEDDYGSGKVARLVGAAAISNGMIQNDVYRFQSFAADYYHTPGGPFASHDPTSAVSLTPGAIRVDDNRVSLPRTPALVIDYAACLTGRSIARDQIGFLNHGTRPFAYSPLTRTHFMNRVLMMDYDARVDPGTSKLMIDNGLYIGREDGVAAATEEIISSQESYGAPVEVADVILCTHAQHSTGNDLRTGIANAYTILKEEGLLVIRGFTRPAPDEIGVAQMETWAYDAGFQESQSRRFDATMDQLGTLLVGSHFRNRQMQSVIVRK